jgi:hypothetical protein
MIRASIRGVLASCLALWPMALSGQAASKGECDKAATIVAKGHTSQADDWTFSALRPCGATGGRAFAVGLAHYARESDVAALEDYMTQVDNWRDASIFDAVIDLATNSAASPQARVFAIRHLILLEHPQFVLTYAGLTRKADTTVTRDMVVRQEVGCVVQMTSAPHGSIKGSPLPPDYLTRLRATLVSLANSSDVPVPVRYAAGCGARSPIPKPSAAPNTPSGVFYAPIPRKPAPYY